MVDPHPGGLPEGTTLRGFIRETPSGDLYVPCACGQAVQRPDATAAERIPEATRVFVCEDEDCDQRTVQQRLAATDVEGDT